MASVLSRRSFLLNSALGTTALGLAQMRMTKLAALPAPPKVAEGFFEDLLARWCDALLRHQVREIQIPGIHGGILCPLCSRIHGRSADAIQPLLRRAKLTGQDRYLQAAIQLQAWSEHVSRSDGSWVNEPTGNEWKGITVGGVLALAESLGSYGSLLDATVRQRWQDRMAKGARFIYDFIRLDSGNINYPISAAAAMAAVGQLLDEPRYRERARELARGSLNYLSPENHLIFGEGTPPNGRSPMGCRAVDLGYNVEESLPNFARYALLTQDVEVMGPLVESLRSHLAFLLPDGAWDNSWGTRNFKWTYWGTRTGDGCQAAYALLAKEDPRFAIAALRNAQLLDRCTHQGLLMGGPHFVQQGELPCIHHTFCHARGLATALAHGSFQVQPNLPLPRDGVQGLQSFPEIRTWLADIGPWRSTLTAYDWVYDAEQMPAGHASGGALSMLWHARFGLVLTASVTEYILMEASNMQPPREGTLLPLTPRLELETREGLYGNLHELSAQVIPRVGSEGIGFEVHGSLKDRKQKPLKGPNAYQLEYAFTAESVTLGIQANVPLTMGKVRFHLPVVCAQDERVRTQGSGLEIQKPGGHLRIFWNQETQVVDPLRRRFHPVPGVQTLPLVWELEPGKRLLITLRGD